MRSATLVVMRHGESTWTDKTQNRFAGWVDIPLTERGRDQARHAGKLMRDANIKPDAAFTSLLRRSIETCDIVLDAVDRLWVPVMRSWRLNERHYGTPRGPVQAQLDAGRPALLEIDLAGARQVRESMPSAQLVFVMPPSWNELVARLTGRRTEDIREQERRLATARTEMDAAGEFDHVIVNDTVSRATSELEELLGLGG